MKLHVQLNNNNRIIGYQTFPIIEGEHVYEIESIPEDLTSGCYAILDNKIVYVGFTKEQVEEQKEQHKNELRQKREVLMRQGFDPWEKAVLRGREVDDPAIMLWYENLKKLEDSAFETIPERIKYYLGEK